MIPPAFALSDRYAELKMPVVVVAGEGDRILDVDKHSVRFHNAITNSSLFRLPHAGHMVHQTATGAVVLAIDKAAAA